MNTVISFEGVSKVYGHVSAIRALSLKVSEGEVLGLLGHNGAGKTTTIKLILGVIVPSAGRVTVLGQQPYVKAARSLRMQWGYLPESVSFYEQLSGREVLTYFARLKRASTSEVNKLLERVGLSEAAERRVKTYSKGMRQRLGLAQALLGNPKLLLLDEPTVGLDPIAVRDFFQTLDDLRRQGTTVILCSHVLPGIERHIDRVAILRSGALQVAGSIDELRREAKLPLRISAKGNWAKGFWEPRLREYDLTSYQLNCTRIDIDSPLETKLEVIRLLLSEQSVQDIDVQAPTLESLYVHFNRDKVETDYV